MSEETIKISGYSEGDISVGIWSIPFEIDTGLIEMDKEERQRCIDIMIMGIYELHDNGTIYFNFSDEIKDEWGFELHTFGYNQAKKLIDDLKERFST